jgi:hypothetical protein
VRLKETLYFRAIGSKTASRCAALQPVLTRYKLRGAIRWLKGGENFQASREAKRPYNSISMRVQAPPLTCRGDSISPNPTTGSQRVEAGINGETLGASPGLLAEQEPMGSESKDVLEPS